jgi:hypothetical protein
MSRTRWMSRKALLTLGTPAVSAALFLGVTSLEAHASPVPNSVAQGAAAVTAPGSYPTNADGQTYGSAAGAQAGPAAQEPDLISATGAGLSGGGVVTGYVLKSQLDASTGADVTTPAQAAAWAGAHTGTNATASSIPIYAEDGTTVIGTFTIRPEPAPTETTSTSP